MKNQTNNIKCECGSVVNNKYLEKHKKTKLHKNKISLKESRTLKKIHGRILVSF